MLSLRRPRTNALRSRRHEWLAVLAASLATWGSFVVVLLSAYRITRVHEATSTGPEPTGERIVLVMPHVERTSAVDRSMAEPARRPLRPVMPPPRDTGSTEVGSSESTGDPIAPSPRSALSIDATSRLARPRPERAGRWMAPRARDSFAEQLPLDPVVRDSVLTALSTMTPEAAARRVPLRAEIDSAAKEATLKMRLAGRPLLVPPDNSRGLVTARVPLPGGPSSATRARVQRADDEGQARLRRLLARADSIRRAREDSLERASTVP